MTADDALLLAAAACLEEQAATALTLATELGAQACELRALAFSQPVREPEPAPEPLERETHADPPVAREQLVFDLIVRDGAMTSVEMADKLGLTEKQVLYCLKKLQSDGDVKRIGWSRGVRWTLPSDPRRASLQSDDIEAIVRDRVRQIDGEFTADGIAEDFPLHVEAMRVYLNRLVKRGALTYRKQGHGKDHHKRIYHYTPPRKRVVNRPKRKTPEQELMGRRQRGGKVASSRAHTVRNKDVADLLEAITAAGGEIVKGSRHWKVRFEGNVIGTVPTSPSDHRALKNARANLRRAGLGV